MVLQKDQQQQPHNNNNNHMIFHSYPVGNHNHNHHHHHHIIESTANSSTAIVGSSASMSADQTSSSLTRLDIEIIDNDKENLFNNTTINLTIKQQHQLQQQQQQQQQQQISPRTGASLINHHIGGITSSNSSSSPCLLNPFTSGGNSITQQTTSTTTTTTTTTTTSSTTSHHNHHHQHSKQHINKLKRESKTLSSSLPMLSVLMSGNNGGHGGSLGSSIGSNSSISSNIATPLTPPPTPKLFNFDQSDYTSSPSSSDASSSGINLSSSFGVATVSAEKQQPVKKHRNSQILFNTFNGLSMMDQEGIPSPLSRSTSDLSTLNLNGGGNNHHHDSDNIPMSRSRTFCFETSSWGSGSASSSGSSSANNSGFIPSSCKKLDFSNLSSSLNTSSQTVAPQLPVCSLSSPPSPTLFSSTNSNGGVGNYITPIGFSLSRSSSRLSCGSVAAVTSYPDSPDPSPSQTPIKAQSPMKLSHSTPSIAIVGNHNNSSGSNSSGLNTMETEIMMTMSQSSSQTTNDFMSSQQSLSSPPTPPTPLIHSNSNADGESGADNDSGTPTSSSQTMNFEIVTSPYKTPSKSSSASSSSIYLGTTKSPTIHNLSSLSSNSLYQSSDSVFNFKKRPLGCFLDHSSGHGTGIGISQGGSGSFIMPSTVNRHFSVNNSDAATTVAGGSSINILGATTTFATTSKWIKASPDVSTIKPKPLPFDNDSSLSSPSQSEITNNNINNIVNCINNPSHPHGEEYKLRLNTCTFGKPGFNNITPDTLSELMDDPNNNITIIDCRYPYEYNGGHILNAINIPPYGLEETLRTHFFGPQFSNNRNIIIFHCEFSSKRAPDCYSKFRFLDRRHNPYPNIHYRDIYLLNGGYKKFYETFPKKCLGEYVRMDDPKYQEEKRREEEKKKEEAKKSRFFKERSQSFHM